MNRIAIFLALFVSALFAYNEDTVIQKQTRGEKPATVRVLLSKDSSGTLVEVRGPYKVYDLRNGHQVSFGKFGKRFYMHPHKEGIKWGEDFLGIHQLRLAPTSEKTTFFVGGVQYKGTLDVFHIEEKMTLVNEVAVEDFIKSTLAPEFDHAYGSRVMEGVAIVARTSAYANVLSNKEAFWHYCAKKSGYGGYAVTMTNDEVESAVDATRALVMTLDGAPFASDWTENSAGKTAKYSAIYRKNLPATPGIDAPIAKESRHDHKWYCHIPRDQIAKIARTNRVTSLETLTDPESNKAYAVRIHDGSRHRDIDFFALRSALGKSKLMSNDFDAKIDGNVVTFEGFGQGSGVGLCLYSAGFMSKRGDTVPEILGTFFPLSHLEKIHSYPDPLLCSNENRLVLPVKPLTQGIVDEADTIAEAL